MTLDKKIKINKASLHLQNACDEASVCVFLSFLNMKNVCNFNLTYDIYYVKKIYLHQLSLHIFAKKKIIIISLDMSKNVQVNLIKIKHN